MAMRVTDSMMSHNSIRNVNTNKDRLNTLQTQYSTQKKITRPSDDPIIAMRSLRLRSTKNQLTQYVDRNLPDAQSWMELTEDTLDSVGNMMQYMYSELIQASQDQESIDREKLIESLQSYKERIYAEANADYAGRTLFTGYRTDSYVTFQTDASDVRYQISETLSATDIDSATYIINKTKMNTTSLDTVTNDELPQDVTASRIRLGYDQLEDASDITSIEYKKTADITASRVVENNNPTVQIDGGGKITIENYRDGTTGVTITDGSATNTYILDKAGRFVSAAGNSENIFARINGDGNLVVEFSRSALAQSSSKGLDVTTGNCDVLSSKLTVTAALNGVVVGDLEATYELKIEGGYVDGNDDAALDAAYQSTIDGDKNITLLTETGELLISDTVRKELEGLKIINGKEPITVTYRKSGFEQNEVLPEQLYDCVDMTNADSSEWKDYYYEADKIEYTVGANQTVHINVNASEVFQPDLGRDIDELVRVLQQNLVADQKVTDINTMLKDPKYADDASQTSLKSMLDAAEKEASAAKNILQTALEGNITNIQNYMADVSSTQANVGNRLAQVEVIITRMEEQKSNVEALQSANEDKDIEEILVEYNSAYAAYQASLTAIGKLADVSLLNYI